jgi:hypothetical protein
MATIWDGDVLIWAASQIVEAADHGLRTFPLLPLQTLPAPDRHRPRSGPKPIRATEAGAPAAPSYCGSDDNPSRRELASNAVLLDQRRGGARRRARKRELPATRSQR